MNIYKDPIYKNTLISKTINILMKKGKKSVIERKLFGSLQLIKMKKKQNPLQVMNKASSNIEANIELRSIKIAGVRYYVPFEINQNRQKGLSIRWLSEAINAQKSTNLTNRFYTELLNAYNQKGYAYKKKDELHKKAEANRSFIHYRW